MAKQRFALAMVGLVAFLWGGCVNVMDFDDDTMGEDSTSATGGSETVVRSTRVRIANRLSGIVLQSGDTATGTDLYGVRIASTVFAVVAADSLSSTRTVSVTSQQTVTVLLDSAVVTIPVCGGMSGGFCSELKIVLRDIPSFVVNVRVNEVNTIVVDQRVIPVREMVDEVTRLAVTNKLQNVTIRTGQNQYYVLGADLYGVAVGAVAFPIVQAGQTTPWTATPQYGELPVTIESMQVTYLSCFGETCDTLQTTVRGFRSSTVMVSKYLRNTVVVDKSFIESALTVTAPAP